MRLPRHAVPAALAAALLLPIVLAAPNAATAESRPSASDARLHPVSKACGKKWAKRAARLPQEQLRWMLRESHGLFEVSAAGRRLMTLELLSGPSYRDCAVETRWARKETTIRITYFALDGDTRTRLVHFASDDTLFDQAPTIYAGIGRALLKGVTPDGGASNRWLDLGPLKTLVAELPAAAGPDFVVARAEPPTRSGL